MRLTVHFEFGSPYTYLAWHRITSHPAYAGVDITWRPMSLWHLVQREGGKMNVELPNMAKTNFQDLRRFAKAYAVPLRFARCWPTPTVAAHRGHLVAEEQGKAAAWRAAVFQALWVDDQDISDLQVLDGLARSVGIDGLLDRIASDDMRQRLVQETEAAYAAGACGSPFLVLEDGEGREVFWGNDRLDWVEARIAGQPAPAHWRMPA